MSISNVNRSSFGLSLLILLLGPISAMGEDAVRDIGDRPTSKSEVVDFFYSPPVPKTATRQMMPQHDFAPSSKKLSMQVNFEFNSYRLTASGKRALQPIGEALTAKELTSMRFAIEGHTDAKGKATYNQYLSERRAEAVKSYLVDQYSIDPARLNSVGKGSTDLLNKSDPYASENRRVVISHLAD